MSASVPHVRPCQVSQPHTLRFLQRFAALVTHRAPRDTYDATLRDALSCHGAYRFPGPTSPGGSCPVLV
jgi:hypothetical protein